MKSGGPGDGQGQTPPPCPSWTRNPRSLRHVLSKNSPVHFWGQYEFKFCNFSSYESLLTSIRCNGVSRWALTMQAWQRRRHPLEQSLHLKNPISSLHSTQNWCPRKSPRPSWRKISSSVAFRSESHSRSLDFSVELVSLRLKRSSASTYLCIRRCLSFPPCFSGRRGRITREVGKGHRVHLITMRSCIVSGSRGYGGWVGNWWVMTPVFVLCFQASVSTKNEGGDAWICC